MRYPYLSLTLLMSAILLLAPSIASAESYYIDSKQAYADIADGLQAGDTVILKNGVWQDFEILLEGEGTEQSPITLKAEKSGEVILSGQSNLRLSGKYLVVSGLVFKDGYTPTSSVIEFRKDKDNYAYHSRVTEIVIDNYNNPDKQESDYWVALYGKHNRFDHSHLVGKRNRGVTLAVRLNHENSQENYHQIDHNYFGYRPIFGSNGGETIRIGTSHYSLSDSFTLVENNVFEHTNGEVEIISVKSGKNTLKGNLFLEARGTLTLRHGNGNIIEENVLIGNGVDHTGGIRVINKDQIIRNNYLEGLTGFRFGSGFTVMNGVPDSPINRYHQVENAVIENNTFINVEHMQLAAGSDAERSAVPISSQFTNNLIVNQNGQNPFTISDDVSEVRFAKNISNTQVPSELKNGFTIEDIALERNENDLLFPAKAFSTKNGTDVGASRSLKKISKDEVGVSWYPKLSPLVEFDSGKTRHINLSTQSLSEAIQQAESGDTLLLEAGDFVIPKLIPIDKTLSIKAKNAQQTRLSCERTALFEIQDGGALKLDGLVLSGANSPDSANNAVVRTQKWGMIENYRFELHNSIVENLDINHSFHFFVSGKGAFADHIHIENNQFKSVTGDIIQLNKEIEDLGIYNAEYITFHQNQFSDIAGALAKVYRGGTDESTFGPHFLFTDNQVSATGKGKRNKENASVYLHGVQQTHIANNLFENSAPIVIEHTVGEPQTLIENNTFKATESPNIVELRVDGPHTARLNNNTVLN
uniref:polysaccharide lyase 6 family protein n=1 Tax=Ningiella ruwaisensis TaxID=2364274 RepID=UPI00109FE55E|nr:polysaccharide lyase 6 family protein [Ningiella ruwaisensis]